MIYICVSVSVSPDGERKARLCPLVEYSKDGKFGSFINTNQSLWFTGVDAEHVFVGESKNVAFSLSTIDTK